jgi:hypothetical protein
MFLQEPPVDVKAARGLRAHATTGGRWPGWRQTIFILGRIQTIYSTIAFAGRSRPGAILQETPP